MTFEIRDHKLYKSFEFENFAAALEFVNRVGELAESMDHHPDIYLRDYRFVDISTMTHDAGKITELDHSMAQKILEI